MCALLSLAHLSKPPGHSPHVGKSFQPRQTLSVLASRAAADALFGLVAPVCARQRDVLRPCAAPKASKEGLNHAFARNNTLALPRRTCLQFIRQAFPASAEKQTDSSLLLLPADWCLSPPPSPPTRRVLSESLHYECVTGALNSLSTRVRVTTTLTFFDQFLFCVCCTVLCTAAVAPLSRHGSTSYSKQLSAGKPNKGSPLFGWVRVEKDGGGVIQLSKSITSCS